MNYALVSRLRRTFGYLELPTVSALRAYTQMLVALHCESVICGWGIAMGCGWGLVLVHPITASEISYFI